MALRSYVAYGIGSHSFDTVLNFLPSTVHGQTNLRLNTVFFPYRICFYRLSSYQTLSRAVQIIRYLQQEKHRAKPPLPAHLISR